ncbi:MAG: hypothetical protein AABX19_00550 [Nanoarchaeota archaeon]
MGYKKFAMVDNSGFIDIHDSALIERLTGANIKFKRGYDPEIKQSMDSIYIKNEEYDRAVSVTSEKRLDGLFYGPVEQRSEKIIDDMFCEPL